MWVEVDLASFMAVAFDKVASDMLTFEQLAKLRDKANRDLEDLEAEIDWSRDSFRFAVGFYNYLFDEVEDKGVRCLNREEMRNSMKYITDRVPKKVIKRLQESLAG